MGTAAELLLNNEKTTLDTEIKDGDNKICKCAELVVKHLLCI